MKQNNFEKPMQNAESGKSSFFESWLPHACWERNDVTPSTETLGRFSLFEATKTCPALIYFSWVILGSCPVDATHKMIVRINCSQEKGNHGDGDEEVHSGKGHTLPCDAVLFSTGIISKSVTPSHTISSSNHPCCPPQLMLPISAPPSGVPRSMSLSSPNVASGNP
jgi:hypothetical protein